MSKTPDIAGAPNSKVALNLKRVLSYTVLTLFAFISLFPFFILIVNMTRESSQIQRQSFALIPGTNFIPNLSKVVNNRDWQMLPSLKNSFIIAASSAFLSTYFSALTAYAIHVYHFRLRKILFTFILMIMMIPTQVTALGFVRLVGELNMKNSFWPLIIPSIAAPATFFFMKQYMDSSLPLEIVEAARIDGSGEFRTFNSLILQIGRAHV